MVTMRRNLRLCTSVLLVVSNTFVGATTSDSLWDSAWGSCGDSCSSPSSSEMAAFGIEEIPSEPTKKPTTKSTSASTAADNDDEPWREKEDWWKDPLAMFGDDDELVDDVKATKQAKAERAAKEKAAREKNEQAAKEQAAQKKAVKQQEALEKREQEKRAKEQAAQEKQARKLAAREEKEAQKTLDEWQGTDSPSSSSSSSGISMALPASILASSMPALKAGLSKMPFLASPVSAVGVVASVLVGKMVVDKINTRRQAQLESSEDEGTAILEEYNEALMEDTLQMQYQMDEMRYSDEEETEDISDDIGVELDSDIDSSISHSRHDHDEVDRYGETTKSTSPSPAFISGLRSALVGGHSRPDGGKLAMGGGGRRVKVTTDELEYLKTVADKAMIEKQAMEKEYEKTSFQLQEAQSEVTQLASTTKYLKAQLHDYEEMMDRTIRNERKKASVEIQRMKEVMEASIEQDRETLRRQFTKELERLQTQYEIERARKENESMEDEATPEESKDENDTLVDENDDDDDSSPQISNEPTANSPPDSTDHDDEGNLDESPTAKVSKPRKKNRKGK